MKKIYFLALSCAVLLSMASCSLDDTKNQQVLSGYFTITGSYPNYKLIHDNGSVIVYPSTEEVSEVTKKKDSAITSEFTSMYITTKMM